MDDRREPPAEQESGPQLPGPIPFGGPRLSPVQRAHSHYSDHANQCPQCRDIDRGRCETGEQLWRDWNTACDEAYQQLHGGAR